MPITVNPVSYTNVVLSHPEVSVERDDNICDELQAMIDKGIAIDFDGTATVCYLKLDGIKTVEEVDALLKEHAPTLCPIIQ